MPTSKGSVKWRLSVNKKYVSNIENASDKLTENKVCINVNGKNL
jgi:hypothetical protein